MYVYLNLYLPLSFYLILSFYLSSLSLSLSLFCLSSFAPYHYSPALLILSFPPSLGCHSNGCSIHGRIFLHQHFFTYMCVRTYVLSRDRPTETYLHISRIDAVLFSAIQALISKLFKKIFHYSITKVVKVNSWTPFHPL